MRCLQDFIGLPAASYTLLQINMDVERGPYTSIILYIGPPICFHVYLGEGRFLFDIAMTIQRLLPRVDLLLLEACDC